MWRAEDIFFAAMGGGNYGGPGIEHRRGHRASLSATPVVSFALAPLMHGNAQWSTFVALFGGNTVALNASRRFDADEIWDLVEREDVSVISLVGDAMARPLVDALAHRAGTARRCSRSSSGGAILSPAIKAGAQRACSRTCRSSTRSARRRPAPTARSTSPTRVRASA